MNEKLKNYLDSDETGFYESNYGSEDNPCVFYHFSTQGLNEFDVLKYENGSLYLYSLNIKIQRSELTDYIRGVDYVFDSVEKVKELEMLFIKYSSSCAE